jgi:hypothetical protein
MMQMFRALLVAVTLAVLNVSSEAASDRAFRPPAVPLVTHDPYFSIWSAADRLTDQPTRHWTGTPHPMTGLARIDGRPFRVMGHLPASVPALPQRAVTVGPLRTVYIFEDASVELTLTFLSPTLPHDLELVSRPASYVTFQVRSTDGGSHDVALYFDAVNTFERPTAVMPQQDRSDAFRVSVAVHRFARASVTRLTIGLA